jgi:hypothetical protein
VLRVGAILLSVWSGLNLLLAVACNIAICLFGADSPGLTMMIHETDIRGNDSPTTCDGVRLRPVEAGDLPRMYDLQLDPDSNRMAVTIPRTREAFDSNCRQTHRQFASCRAREISIVSGSFTVPACRSMFTTWAAV